MQKSWEEPIRLGYSENRCWERESLEMPLRFRKSDLTVWCEGIARNISSSGIFFRAEQTMEIHTQIQMSYILPPTVAAMAGLTVNCNGEVVRVETPSPNECGFVFAVKILEYSPAAR